MIRAAREGRVRLMTAYRLHFERSNLTAIDLVAKGRLGEPRIFSSVFTMQLSPGNIRSNPIERGGGTLYDIGIYCINAARYLFRAEPADVEAPAPRSGGGDPSTGAAQAQGHQGAGGLGGLISAAGS
jgi:predicted dehydrogenase